MYAAPLSSDTGFFERVLIVVGDSLHLGAGAIASALLPLLGALAIGRIVAIWLKSHNDPDGGNPVSETGGMMLAVALIAITLLNWTRIVDGMAIAVGWGAQAMSRALDVDLSRFVPANAAPRDIPREITVAHFRSLNDAAQAFRVMADVSSTLMVVEIKDWERDWILRVWPASAQHETTQYGKMKILARMVNGIAEPRLEHMSALSRIKASVLRAIYSGAITLASGVIVLVMFIVGSLSIIGIYVAYAAVFLMIPLALALYPASTRFARSSLNTAISLLVQFSAFVAISVFLIDLALAIVIDMAWAGGVFRFFEVMLTIFFLAALVYFTLQSIFTTTSSIFLGGFAKLLSITLQMIRQAFGR